MPSSAASGIAPAHASRLDGLKPVESHAAQTVRQALRLMFAHRNQAAVITDVMAMFEAYEQGFTPYRGNGSEPSPQSMFNRISPQELLALLDSRQVVSRVTPRKAEIARTHMDAYNVATHRPYRDINTQMLGVPGSVLHTGTELARELLRPENLVSTLDSHYVSVAPGDRRWLNLLTLAAPALDSPMQPEYRLYVDGAGNLRKDRYAAAIQEIADHVLTHAGNNPQLTRVVLSAIGGGAFLQALKLQDRNAAQDIQARVWAQLAVKLRDMGRDVVYSDLQPSSPVWDRVNTRLAPEDQIHYVGVAPGPWMRPTDMIMINGDKLATDGNECVDTSQEGSMGKASTMHAAATLRAQILSSLSKHGFHESPWARQRHTHPASMA